MSGIEDLVDAQEALPEVVMGEMSKKIEANHSSRQNKQSLKIAETDDSIRENVQFFDSVEGFAPLSPASAIDGLYVVTKPSLGLAKTDSSIETISGEKVSAIASIL